MSSTGFQLDKNFWLHLIKRKAFEPKIKIMVKTAAIYLKQKIFPLFLRFSDFDYFKKHEKWNLLRILLDEIKTFL